MKQTSVNFPAARGVSGFTLIELVLSLMILGLIGAMGAMGFTDAVRGYLHGVDNANLAGKAQAALDRIRLELTHVDFWDDVNYQRQDGITTSSQTSITYDVDFGDNRGKGTDLVLAYNSGGRTITLKNGANARTLVDGVTNFSFAYYDDPADTTAQTSYTPGTTMCIGITMELTGVNGQPVVFNTRVVPMFDLPFPKP